MKVVILSMTIFAFIGTILIIIDLIRVKNKLEEVVTKHNLIIELFTNDIKRIEQEVENLKNKMK